MITLILKNKPVKFFNTFQKIARSYLFKAPAAPGPLIMGWDITNACNCRCVMCDKWKQNTDTFLCKEDKIRIVRDMAQSGVWWLNIGGGEPFLDPDIGEVVREAKINRLKVKITTNGSLLSENLDTVGLLDYLIISVDSYRGEIHDSLRGMPGLFDKILNGIKEIKKLDKRPRLAVRLLVTKANLESLDDYIQYWHGKVDDVFFQPVHERINEGWHIPQQMSGAVMDDEHIKTFNRVLKKWNLYNRFNRQICDFLKEDADFKNPYQCFSGYFFLQLIPDGNLFNCFSRKYQLGNLKKNTLASLIEKNKNIIRDYCKNARNCSCWAQCVNVNIYLADIFKFFKH